MFYSRSTLDRADHIRKDDATLNTLRASSHARLVPVRNNKNLVTVTDQDTYPEALFITPDFSSSLTQEVFLGQDGINSYFAIDVSELSEPECQALCQASVTHKGNPCEGQFSDLRLVGPTLSDEQGALLAYARGLVYWNQNTRHCIRCGETLLSQHGGHSRRCTNEACRYVVFPRTDPAVIMLVCYQPDNHGEERCLLGRSHSWPEGVFSTLAGFVEPGESLEQAVQREVYEEAAIRTTNVRYIASQPWPFPRSIMLGFEATATNTQIRCDPNEIESAEWFTRQEILQFGAWGDDSTGFKLPRTDSIARYLIDHWVSRGEPK